MKQPSEMKCLKTTSIYQLQADFFWLWADFYSVLLTSTHLSIKRSSLFKLNKFSRMVSIYKMNKYKLCTADFSNQLKKKTVSKLCFENLQNKQYHHSCSEDGKKSSQETPSQFALRALNLSFKWVNFFSIKNP